jgi:hypothetical protein
MVSVVRIEGIIGAFKFDVKTSSAGGNLAESLRVMRHRADWQRA